MAFRRGKLIAMNNKNNNSQQMRNEAKFFVDFYHPTKQWMIFSSFNSYSTGIKSIGDFFKIFKVFKNNLYYLNFISQYKDIHPKGKIEFFNKPFKTLPRVDAAHRQVYQL